MFTLFTHQRALALLRMVSGLMILSAGANKILVIGAGNFSNFIHTLPQLGMMQDVVGLALPYVEVLLGVLLIFGVFTRITSLVAAFIFGGMIFYMGFFSKAGELMMNFHTYIFLNALCLATIGKEPTAWSFDEWFKKYQKSKNVKKIKA